VVRSPAPKASLIGGVIVQLYVIAVDQLLPRMSVRAIAKYALRHPSAARASGARPSAPGDGRSTYRRVVIIAEVSTKPEGAVTKAEAPEPRMEEGAAEAAVEAFTKPDENSDRPSPPPRITPAPWIVVGPEWVVIGIVYEYGYTPCAAGGC
jgi:hypothetical protein